MTRSLRARLIAGMLVGMTLLLAAACTILYAVQRRQLYRAFDDALLDGANSLVLLIHHRTPEFWFDFEELAKLPASRMREGAVFQFWSDYPISLSPPPMGRERGGPEEGPPPLPSEVFGPPGLFGPPDEPPGGRRGPPREPPGQRRGRGQEQLADGVLVIRSPLLQRADLPRIPTETGQPTFQDMTLPDGSRGRAVGLDLRWDVPERGPRRGGGSAQVTAVVAAGTAEIQAQLGFLATLLVLTALGTMAISGGVVWLVVSRGLHPLAAVAREIAAMDERGLKQQIDSTGVPREIEPVVNQLNGLLGRLDGAFDRERALTADVAHELRSPVAEIRAIIEITLSQTRSPAEYGQALGETLETTETLQSLIEKLLVLARLEAGQLKPELELVPLQPLLAGHWAQLRARLESRGITCEDHSSPESTVLADLKLLEVVLGNVLSNAATYVPDGGRIAAEVREVDGGCQLSIANTGCTLSKAEVAKVFDRFWRSDPARSKTGLNCGLGLTLVRRAMEVMEGTAEAGVSDDACFIVKLIFKRGEGGSFETPA